MTDAAALIEACRAADRDDDLPRLVFADFVEERGDGEYAEFVRVQCELVRLRCQPGWLPPFDTTDLNADTLQALFRVNNSGRETRIDDLRWRERELLSRNEVAWLRRSAGWLVGDYVNHLWQKRGRFSRGFIDELTFPTVPAFLAAAPALLAACPLVTRVGIAGREPEAFAGGWFGWDFEMRGLPDRPQDLPVEVWRLLPDEPLAVARADAEWEHGLYTSHHAALDAASAAFLAHCRSLAEVPA